VLTSESSRADFSIPLQIGADYRVIFVFAGGQ
jgi:hypothetical protein